MAKTTKITPEMVELAEKLGVDPSEVSELAALGFTVPDTEAHYRMIVSSSARDKHGKTDWALRTAPQPIAMIDTDIGTEGILEREPFKSKRIIQKTFNLRARKKLAGEAITKSEIQDEWDQVSQCIRTLVNTPFIRTLVVDTATEVWEIARLAYLGQLTQVMPHQYTEVNKVMRELVQLVYGRKDLNAIFIHKQKKEYVNDKFRGDYQLSGFSDMPFLVQVNIEHLRDDDTGQFGIKVLNCRQNKDMNNEELWGLSASFRALGKAVFPDSKSEDWK